MLVAFRTDSSIQIGTGHVLRCLTLADELQNQGSKCLFICHDLSGNLGSLIRSRGHNLVLLSGYKVGSKCLGGSKSDNYAEWLPVTWQEDARQTVDAISGLKPDFLVIDHYALDANWERIVSNSVKYTMVIDDLANRMHQCTLLLDQNLGSKVSDYDKLLPKECSKLIGPHFALLRPEFAAIRQKSLERRKNTKIKRILISFGGVDSNNVTGQILEALADSKLSTSTELDIIMGSSAPHLEDVRRLSSYSPFNAKVSVDVHNMAERMYSADFSIGAAGGTSWERCSVGLPSLIIELADNQHNVFKALEASEAVIAISDIEQLKSQLPLIISKLNNADFISHMTAAAANITDGLGRLNVIKVMIKIYECHDRT
jgi:UDP-2,4-diacetamido-2,4,6-trideoxy-beta-L-altropyranose hydrolase